MTTSPRTDGDRAARKAERKAERDACRAQLGAASGNRIFTFETLHLKGITFHRNYIRRLVKAGGFPAPFRLSERRPAWTEAALDEWIAELQRKDGTDAR
jgi:predicted DNA-binding transcriptional regulator AlpA